MKAKIFLLFMLIVVGVIPYTATAQKIVKGEYFFDSDPGVGNGLLLSSLPTGKNITYSQNISLAGLNNGIHKLFVRLRDSAGRWSMSEGRSILVFTDSTSKVKVQSAEYYIDNDPGPGNGIALNSFTSSNSVILDQSVNVKGKVESLHTLNVRCRMSNGIWSTAQGRVFKHDTSSFKATKLVAAEYFFKTDSGNGKGFSLFKNLDSAGITFQTNININGIGEGINEISIRVKNNKNIWSPANSKTFFVFTKDTQSINKVEYYIDNDPGPGNATPVAITNNLKSLDLSIPVNINAIVSGFHQLSFRIRTSSGKWSTSGYKTFLVNPIKPIAPIDKIEYFFDTDPGLGKGNAIGSISKTFNLNTDLNIDLTNVPTGIHNAYIRVKDTAGNYSLYGNKSFNICTVLPVADFNANSVCIGKAVITQNLTSANDTATTYAWDFNNDGINDSLSFAPTHLYNTAGTYTIRLIAANGSGCSDTVTKSIIVAPSIASVVTITRSTSFCEGDSVILSSQGNYPSYLWSNGVTKKTNIVKQSGIYTLKVDNGVCSAISSPVNVDVTLLAPTPVVTSINGSLESSVTIGNQWYEVNKGKLPGETNNLLIPYESGNYYTIVTQLGCSTPPSDLVNFVYDSLNCYTDYGFIVNHSALTVSFTNLSANSTNVKWSFGDGKSSILQNPVHLFTTKGKYNVCMISIDSVSSCLKKVCKEILVGDAGCKATFAYTVDNNSKTASFTDQSSGTTEWFWDFGDGTVIKNRNTSHTYSANGLFKVCHWVRNASTGCFDQSCNTIKVGTEDTVVTNSSFVFYMGEKSLKAIFSNKSSSNVNSYYWTFGDGSYTTDENPVYTFSKKGTYNVCLKVFDSKTGQLDEHCEKVVVGDSVCNLTPAFSAIVKQDREVIFYNQSSGSINRYYWNFGDGSTSAQKDPVHKFVKPGFYLVSISIKNDTTKCANYYSEFLKVGEQGCHAEFEYLVDPASDSVHFINKSKGSIDKYFWQFGNGNFSFDESPVVKYSNSGIYKANLLIVDTLSDCSDNFSATVQVGNVLCNAKYGYYVDSIDNTVYFTNEVFGESTNLLWSFGDGKISSKRDPVHQYTRSGYYKAGLNTFNSNEWCMDYYEQTILVGNSNTDCEADFVYQSDEGSNEVKFFDKSLGNIVGYYWNYGDNSYESDVNPLHIYNKSGYYNVCHLVVNSKLITNINCKPVVASPGADNTCRADFNFTVDSAKRKAFFTDASEGSPSKWEWSFGDGTTDIKSNTSYTYKKSGYFLVGLRITNTKTGCINKTYKLLNIASIGKMKAGFAFEEQPFDKKAGGYPVDFIGAGLGDEAKLKWTFGDNSDPASNVDSTTTSPTHTYDNPGTYKVCYEISDPVTGQKDSACQWVKTKQGPITSVEKVTESGNFELYPNPFTTHSLIEYNLMMPAVVEISVYDLNGRLQETLLRTEKSAGKHDLLWNTTLLSKGAYIIKLTTNKGLIINKMVVKN